eukprot:310230-Chlamydomonas_euryale.AAC.1
MGCWGVEQDVGPSTGNLLSFGARSTSTSTPQVHHAAGGARGEGEGPDGATPVAENMFLCRGPPLWLQRSVGVVGHLFGSREALVSWATSSAPEKRWCHVLVRKRSVTGWLAGWLDGWTDARTDGRTDRQMDGWTTNWGRRFPNHPFKARMSQLSGLPRVSSLVRSAP